MKYLFGKPIRFVLLAALLPAAFVPSKAAVAQSLFNLHPQIVAQDGSGALWATSDQQRTTNLYYSTGAGIWKKKQLPEMKNKFIATMATASDGSVVCIWDGSLNVMLPIRPDGTFEFGRTFLMNESHMQEFCDASGRTWLIADAKLFMAAAGSK